MIPLRHQQDSFLKGFLWWAWGQVHLQHVTKKMGFIDSSQSVILCRQSVIFCPMACHSCPSQPKSEIYKYTTIWSLNMLVLQHSVMFVWVSVSLSITGPWQWGVRTHWQLTHTACMTNECKYTNRHTHTRALKIYLVCINACFSLLHLISVLTFYLFSCWVSIINVLFVCVCVCVCVWEREGERMTEGERETAVHYRSSLLPCGLFTLCRCAQLSSICPTHTHTHTHTHTTQLGKKVTAEKKRNQVKKWGKSWEKQKVQLVLYPLFIHHGHSP